MSIARRLLWSNRLFRQTNCVKLESSVPVKTHKSIIIMRYYKLNLFFVAQLFYLKICNLHEINIYIYFIMSTNSNLHFTLT